MMTRLTAQQNTIKGKAQADLMASLGAVQAALSALPEAPRAIRALSPLGEAFITADPVLVTLHRQLLDARRNAKQIENAFGPADPMMEALTLQIEALETAYANRLAALRRKREEGERSHDHQNDFDFRTDDKEAPEVRRYDLPQQQRDHGAMWSLAFLFLMQSALSSRKYGLVPKAA